MSSVCSFNGNVDPRPNGFVFCIFRGDVLFVSLAVLWYHVCSVHLLWCLLWVIHNKTSLLHTCILWRIHLFCMDESCWPEVNKLPLLGCFTSTSLSAHCLMPTPVTLSYYPLIFLFLFMMLNKNAVFSFAHSSIKNKQQNNLRNVKEHTKNVPLVHKDCPCLLPYSEWMNKWIN